MLKKNVPMEHSSSRCVLARPNEEVVDSLKKLNIAEKLSTLAKEFDHVRQQSATLPFWNNILWQKNELNLDDWVLVDAWFRSRSMRIQEVGDAMVPAIDMVNHSDQPAAYYDQALINEIELILHSEAIDWPPGVEITISYGDHKPPSEMLFNYGFIDPKTTFDSMALRLYPFADDPLGKAKLHTSPSPPFFVIGQVKANPDELLVSQVEWLSPWIYLVCLNEEDGLGFRILEDVQGRQQLRVLWQEEDITEDVDQLEVFANRHPLCDVFKLRAATVVQQKILSQLARLNRGPPEQQPRTTSQAAGSPEPERVAAAEQLRAIERRLMEGALITLDEEVRISPRPFSPYPLLSLLLLNQKEIEEKDKKKSPGTLCRVNVQSGPRKRGQAADRDMAGTIC